MDKLSMGFGLESIINDLNEQTTYCLKSRVLKETVPILLHWAVLRPLSSIILCICRRTGRTVMTGLAIAIEVSFLQLPFR